MILDYISTIVLGVAVGVGASIVPGPVTVICIQRTISGNRSIGFVSGLGAATADTIFALIALFALSYVNSFLEGKQFWLEAVAGILVMLIGFSIFTKKIPRPSTTGVVSNPSYASNYLSVFLLTIINPLYLGAFLLVFAVLGVGTDGMTHVSKLFLILGVLIGTASWWFSLTWLVSKLRRKFSVRNLWRLNKISGGFVIILGAYAIIHVLLQLTKLIPL